MHKLLDGLRTGCVVLDGWLGAIGDADTGSAGGCLRVSGSCGGGEVLEWDGEVCLGWWIGGLGMGWWVRERDVLDVAWRRRVVEGFGEGGDCSRVSHSVAYISLPR